MSERIKKVAFIDSKTAEAYEKLQAGKFEDRKLYDAISRARGRLKDNPQSGQRVPTKQIPRAFVSKHGVDNLWKLNLPLAWRLLYSVIGNSVKIVSVILEWMTHKEYERRFGYG